MKTSKRVTTALALTASAGLILPVAQAAPEDVPGTAGAGTVTSTPEPERPAFYEPPADIPAKPGTLIRSEPAPILLQPLGFNSKTLTSTRVMYSSTDGQGRPIAVTGTVFEPVKPWAGEGERPIVSFAPGTQGMGDACAPSRSLAEGFQYEIAGLSILLSQGYAVAFTDYQGLGTPGTHTYVVREASGRAVLDAVRAAHQTPGSTLSATAPVGLAGYSQGGGGAASAAELASTYAPDLQVKGALVGAVPADLDTVARSLDGGLYGAFLNFAILGLSAENNIDPAPYLNEKGEAKAAATENQCTGNGLASSAFQQTKNLSENGERIESYFDEEPFKSVLAENRIGNRKPTFPVEVTHSMLDDVIPFKVGKQLAKDWCAQGTNVRFSTNLAPTHIGGAIPHNVRYLSFFKERFSGKAQSSSCATLR